MTDMSFRTPEGAEVSYVTITPELAREMLDRNLRNRVVSQRTVEAYVRAMTANQRDLGDEFDTGWPFTGDAIQVGDDGMLLNGQHRLMAVEISGVPRGFLVVSNLPLESQRYMDAGRKRSVADQLKMEEVTNGAQKAATARLLLQWAHWRKHRTAILPINAEVMSFVLEHNDALANAFRHASDVYKETRALRPVVAAAFFRACEVTGDVFAVSNWFTRLATGENLVMGDPLMSLRGSLVRREHGSTNAQLYKVVRAWNASVAGETLRTMQLPRNGVTITNFPDMHAPKAEDVSEAAEAAAEAQQRMREAG